MKKALFGFAAILAGLAVAALEIPPANPLDSASYSDYRISYFQVGIFPGLPASQNQSWVYGIKSGWPMCSGQGAVSGLEASWTGSLTEHIYGIQASWLYCQNSTFVGLQATLGIDVNKDSFYGLQAAPVFCYAGDFRGVQASAINVSGNYIGWQPAAIMNAALGLASRLALDFFIRTSPTTILSGEGDMIVPHTMAWGCPAASAVTRTLTVPSAFIFSSTFAGMSTMFMHRPSNRFLAIYPMRISADTYRNHVSAA